MIRRWLLAMITVVTALALAGIDTAAASVVPADSYFYDAPIRTRVELDVAATSGSELLQPSNRSPISTVVVAGRCFYDLRRSLVATNTVDDAMAGRPDGVPDDYVPEVANNGKGTVWRAPGSTGNAGTVRIMDPTAQYPDGYVRFYSSSGQPLGLDGKPGPNSATHIALEPDGSYPVPKGWAC